VPAAWAARALPCTVLTPTRVGVVVTPPHVPALSSAEDTSNFDEVEDEEPEKPEKPAKGAASKSPHGFQGEELPFVGYSYTRPFHNHVLVAQPHGTSLSTATVTATPASADPATDGVRRPACSTLNAASLVLMPSCEG
jgi:hypothetical protein